MADESTYVTGICYATVTLLAISLTNIRLLATRFVEAAEVLGPSKHSGTEKV